MTKKNTYTIFIIATIGGSTLPRAFAVKHNSFFL